MATFNWKNGVNGDWGTGALWDANASPNDALATTTISAGGLYTVTIAAGESFTSNSIRQTAGTLSVSGTLTLTGATTDVFANTTIQSGGVLTGTGIANSSANNLLNLGLIRADGGSLQIIDGTLDNRGTLEAINAGVVLAAAITMPGQTGTGTLSAGSYIAIGNGSAINLYAFFGATGAVVENDATITLDGLGSSLFGRDSSVGAFVSLEASLQTIGGTGILTLANNRDFASATGTALTDKGQLVLGGGTLSGSGLTIDTTGSLIGGGIVSEAVTNNGKIEVLGGPTGGTLALSGGYSGTGAITIDPTAMLSLGSASIDVPVLDNGTLRADGGTLTLTAGVSGAGQLLIGSGAILDLTGSSALNAIFYGANAALKLESPGGYTGTLIGFESTDTLDLAGLSPIHTSADTSPDGRTLLVHTSGGTLSFGLNADYSGTSFSVTGDGSTGINVLVNGVNYAYELGAWNTRTITWSYAASNLAQDSAGAQYSSFFTSPGDNAYETVVQNALAGWASLTGINFVQTADSAAVDFRFGWGDFGASSEIGEAAFSYNSATNIFNPDVIIRLQDPSVAGHALNFDGTNYVYQGTVTTLSQVTIHEIGHALGLDHSTDAGAVMYPFAGTTNQQISLSDTAGITALFAATACYARGTRILTAAGEVPVETLRVGDRVPGLVSGRMRRVRWVGHRSLAPERHPRPHDVRPIRVRAHAFAPCTPVRDLLLSPDHAVFADGVLVPVRYLLNGATIAQEPAAEITYFHIELQDDAGTMVHDVLLAEGMPAESYLDTGNRGAFINADGPVMTHPDFALRVWEAEGCAPLRTAGPEVRALRTRLHARAQALGHALGTVPDLHLLARGRRIDGAWDGAVWRARLPGGPATLSSRAAIPAETDPEGIDARRLGVAIVAISLDGAPIALDDPRLGAGWHAPEGNWRWTNGAALLHLPAGMLEVSVAATPRAWAVAA